MIKDRETRLKYYREYTKARRKAAEKDGKCIICCKYPADQEHRTCKYCRDKAVKWRLENDGRKAEAAYCMRKRRAAAKQAGLCGCCCRNLPAE